MMFKPSISYRLVWICCRNVQGRGLFKTFQMKIKRIGNIYNFPNGYDSQPGRVYDTTGISPCLKTPSGGGAVPMIPDEKGIRKLTPKECFRLQGWTDDYFEKAQFVNSDSQLYKQAGNGVTVNVIYEIARRMT